MAESPTTSGREETKNKLVTLIFNFPANDTHENHEVTRNRADI